MAGKRKTGKGGNIFRLKMTKGLTTLTEVKISDNSGAKIGMIIGVVGSKTRLNRYPSATIGDMIVVSIKKGNKEMRKKVMKAIVIRQKQAIKRADGTRLCFEDNAAVIVSDEGEPKGSDIRGPVAREAADKYPRIANLASQIV
jgi:large subunit ribosomal protein L14